MIFLNQTKENDLKKSIQKNTKNNNKKTTRLFSNQVKKYLSA
jgi:hypothetical protein